MINGFQALNTITSGLVLQQLQQDINASNLSQPSIGVDGYLMNSLEQVNSVDNQSIDFTGANGLLSVGTGASAESITRLRSSYLDAQIQQESMLVGYNEVLSNATLASGSSPATPGDGIMNQINAIVNSSTNLTVGVALADLAQAWGDLAAGTGSQAAVVDAGLTFAQTANGQYEQLQSLQTSTNDQINQTVSQINGLLTQLGAINGQLIQTAGSNQNGLLDARDYSLDELSRLMNFQVNYGSDGTANIWLGGLQMLNGTTASSLETVAENPNNPQFVNLVANVPGGIFSTGNTPTQVNVTSSVTGGNLGGEIYGQNTLLQNYKVQIQQLTASVISVTNGIYSAGYTANTNTTNVDFFTGTGASNIAVNTSLVTTPTTLATEIQETSTPANVPANTPLPSGALAKYLSNLPSFLGNNYVTSQSPVGTATLDPTKTLASQGVSGGGSFYVNGVLISYTGANTINDVLNEINSNVPSVYAVFNDVSRTFSFYSASPIQLNLAAGTGDQFVWGNVSNIMVSTTAINNASDPDPFLIFDNNSPLNSTASTIGPGGVVLGPNDQAFQVVPSASGSVTISYTLLGVPTTTVVNWNNTQSLNTILYTDFPSSGADFTVNPTTLPSGVIVGFSITSNSPVQIVDTTGNFTQFTGLNANVAMSTAASDISNSAGSQNTALTTTYNASSDSLTQLNNEQDDIAGVSTGSNNNTPTPGVPIATIQQQAYQDMIQFNAMLEVMNVIDDMLGSLVGISSSTSSSGIFTPESQS